MKYISSQPLNKYFIWQNEIFKHQFQKLGYDLNDSISIFVGENNIPEMDKYIDKYPNTIIVPDQRTDKSYLPSFQIHGMYHLYKDHKNLIENDNIFAHDSDIVFTKHIDWDLLIKNKNTVYCSDTISYIGAVYIDSKSPELLNKMAEIVGIDNNIIRSRQAKSGGAQYIFPTGLTANFWYKIERDCNSLYAYMGGEGSKYKKDDKDYPIQKWTASMWSILWNIWLFGFDTIVDPELEFCWSSWNKKDWQRVSIFHNSGVVNESSGMFFKGKYVSKMPFGDDFSMLTKENCNQNYVEIIKELSHLKEYYS